MQKLLNRYYYPVYFPISSTSRYTDHDEIDSRQSCESPKSNLHFRLPAPNDATTNYTSSGSQFTGLTILISIEFESADFSFCFLLLIRGQLRTIATLSQIPHAFQHLRFLYN